MSDKSVIDQLLASFLEFDRFSRSDAKLSLLLKRGLELYAHFPGAEFASLYLINEETFELEQGYTLPVEKGSTSLKLYQVLFSNGTIGKALSFGTIQVLNHQSGDWAFSAVVPLISSTGVLGLVVFPASESQEAYDDELLSLISTISSAFSNMVTSKKLKTRLESSLDILDQKIASKTIEISESRQSLAKQFESFRSSISMSIPHEVMTPLNQILGFTEYLKDATGDIDTEENQEIFTYIYDAAKRLNHLFENYIYYNDLNMLASDINKLKELKKDVTHSTSHFLENLIQFELAVVDRSQDVHMELTDGSIAVSEIYFKKIVQELFDNCLKYSDPGKEIRISSKFQDDHFHLSFSDKGRGMSPEQIKTIEAFIQFDRSLYEQQGAGLGIAIVSRIIDIYDGKIEIESELGESTTVTVLLPQVES